MSEQTTTQRDLLVSILVDALDEYTNGEYGTGITGDDDVNGERREMAQTLADAILAAGWPRLDEPKQ